MNRLRDMFALRIQTKTKRHEIPLQILKTHLTEIANIIETKTIIRKSAAVCQLQVMHICDIGNKLCTISIFRNQYFLQFPSMSSHIMN